MPSPTTALDIIKTAMKLKGLLAQGETPTADETTDGVRALNDVLEAWSVESYAVWATLPNQFMTVAGKSTYTMGPGGDWGGDRPVSIGDGYTTVNGVDYPFGTWTQAEYDAVGIKSIPNNIALRIVFVNDAPLAKVIVYPTPSAAVPITLSYPRILTQVQAPSAYLTLPPGYVRALQYAVAEELGPQYGSPIDLSAQARSTLAIIKRANRQAPIMQFDPSLMGGRGPLSGWANFYG